jgi:predicted small secreted protein
MMNRLLLAACALVASVVAGCGTSSGDVTDVVGLGADTALPARAGSVVIDGCVLDSWTRASLGLPATKRVLRGGEVIMLCLIPREDGTVGPRDPSARAALADVARDLKNEGYRVHFGLAFTDESGQRYDGVQTRAFLADAAWRRRLKDTLPLVLEPADGVEIDLQFLPSDAEPFVTALVAELSASVRPAKRLNVFVPPSVTVPSDLPGGDAFSRGELAPYVDRMRIMTLDYSEKTPGPTIEPGWAVDAVRLARGDFANVDIAYPLYGTDFGPRGRRPVIYHDAIAISTIGRAPIQRGPTGAPFVSYTAFGGEQHQLWFDDAESTGRALGAWSEDVLPLDVGILFYGLGAEDPALFGRLSGRMP